MNVDSYYRECVHCGRRIQMRKMPSGQWVAYEGYDLVHDCQRQSTQKPSARTEGRNDRQADKFSLYRNLTFADIILPGSVPPPQPVVPMPRVESSNGTNGVHAAPVTNEVTGEVAASQASVQPAVMAAPLPAVFPQVTHDDEADIADTPEAESVNATAADRSEIMSRIGMVLAMVMALVVVVLLLFRPTTTPASPEVVATQAPAVESTPLAVIEATTEAAVAPTSAPIANSTTLPAAIPSAVPTAVPTFTPVAVVVPEVVEPIATPVAVQVDAIPQPIAYVIGNVGEGDIYAIVSDPSQPASVVNSACDEAEPDWSPDGERIVFQANCNGSYDILDVPFNDGAVDAREIRFLTSTSGYDELEPNYSPNGETVVFWRVLQGADRSEDGEIWALDIDSGHSYPLGVMGQAPVWSADGLKLAYMSKRSGKWNVYVRDFISGGDDLVSFGCPTHCGWPEWSPDSSSIAYGSTVSDSNLMQEDIWLWTPPQRIPRKWIATAVGRPSWSTTGLVAFGSGRGLEMSALDNEERQLILEQAEAWSPSWAE